MLAYAESLLDYCTNHSEESLYQASLLSAEFIQAGQGPDEIVAIHFDAISTVTSSEGFTPADRIRVLNDAHQFLLEVMIGYGAQYKEFLELKLEAAVHRAESAERAEKEKLEILAMIAHELGNPLTVALGNMQIAARFLDANDMSNIRDLVADSKQALERLAQLTRQIVAASRGEEQDFDVGPVDLTEVLFQGAGWALRTAEEKDIAVTLPTKKPLVVSGNYESILSIITNLMTNAIRYTPKGGRVDISVGAESELGWLSVSDTGIGIAEEEQPRVFDKFFRGQQAKEIERHGLGMGLHIAQRLAQAQGGDIELSSVPGKGSTFKLKLPLALVKST